MIKNQIVELEITGMSAEGSGVGHFSEMEGERGVAVFVPFTAVGDRLSCRILKVQSNCAYGKLEEILIPSEDRTAFCNDCKVFGKCGGCVYRHVSYEAEQRYKWQRVADALKRIGGLSVLPESLVACGHPDRYRNKGQYPVTAGEHRAVIGLYAARSHRVVEQHDCLLQPEVFQTVLGTVCRWIRKSDVTLYDSKTHQGLLRHIYIRQGSRSGQIMVCLVCTSGKLPQTALLVQELTERVPQMTSLVVNLNREDTNVILGDTCFTLYGEDHITDTLCGLTFRLSPQSFYQVNTEQAEYLYKLVAQAAQLDGTQTVLDLYCGTGTIGLSLAHKAYRLIGVEIVPQAVEDAVKNASDNGITNARFLNADAALAALQLKKEGIHPDVVIVDPPRKGCDAVLIDTVAQMAPSRVVYVSCDPATLARDLKQFAVLGYETQMVTPVDMFPRTAHVESVVLLTKVQK